MNNEEVRKDEAQQRVLVLNRTREIIRYVEALWRTEIRAQYQARFQNCMAGRNTQKE